MERLLEAGTNLEIWRVKHTEIKEQKLNARTMPPQMMERLAENMRKEGRLESLPFGVLRDNHVELVSGHHRVRAAVVAGILEFLMLVDTRDLSGSRVKAKQLAHNSIGGQDDDDILARIFYDIDDVNARIEAYIHLEDKVLASLTGAVKSLNEEIMIDWPVLSIAFLPGQMERLDATCERLARQVAKDADQLWLVPEELARRFTDALNKLGRKLDIRTTGNLVAKMVDITEAWLLAQEAEKEQVDAAAETALDPAGGRLAGRTPGVSPQERRGSRPVPRSSAPPVPEPPPAPDG